VVNYFVEWVKMTIFTWDLAPNYMGSKGLIILYLHRDWLVY